jgi:hypothetical protein
MANRWLARLPGPVRLEAAAVLNEAQQLVSLGDKSAARWAKKQLEYLAEKHEMHRAILLRLMVEVGDD